MANRIRELREEVHMTQIRLSTELEVSQETVSAYETGRHYPSFMALVRMSHIFTPALIILWAFQTCANRFRHNN